MIKNDKTGIPDKALYQWILVEELGKGKTETFTRQEALGIRELWIDTGYGRIKSLEGIGYLSNLESLGLKDHHMADIHGIETLKKLMVLELGYNNLKNLKALSALTNLEVLNVGFNRLSSLRGVEKLKKLQRLEAMGNQLKNAEELEGLKNLRELELSGNKLKDLSFARKLARLKVLSANENRLTDIDEVKNLKDLEELAVRDNRLKKLPDMKKLRKLQYTRCVFYNNNLTEKELRSKFPAHFLKKAKNKKNWLADQINIQENNLKVTWISPKSKGKVTKNTKKITGRTFPGAYVELQNLRTQKRTKRVKAGKDGTFTLKGLNLKKWAGDKVSMNVYVKYKSTTGFHQGGKAIQFSIKK
ncbi:leucine-rich repeat domain-containing protein [Lachnospiraceae bacterium 29-84]